MAKYICWPSVPYLQGKVVCHKDQYVDPITMPKVPKGILDRYNNVTLCCNIMHINSIGILNTISKHIIFDTLSMIENRKVNNIWMGSSRSINCTYNVILISPTYILIVNLYHYSHKLLIFESHSIVCPRKTCPQDWTLQLGRQVTCPILPSGYALHADLKIMIIHIVATAIFCLNTFPPSKPGTGLSNTKIPGQLVIRTILYYKNVFRLQTVKYDQVHQEDETWNTIDIDQTVGAIFLFPQYNLQFDISFR